MYNVPLFDIHPVNADLEDHFQKTFMDVVHSGNFILGDFVEQFEQNMAQYLGVKYAIGVSSGTDALLVALMSLDIKPGDEVLCPSFTFFATASCVSRLGGIPVWVDVRVENFGIDLDDAEKKVGAKTRAIIPVHLFGQTVDMDAVKSFAEKHHLGVIEDTAQAQGALWKNRQAGSMGDLGAFSFFPTKNLGGFGDAGLVCTNDSALAEKARCLRMHGSKVRYHHQYLGGNFRIDTLQAALLNIKLPYVKDAIHCRRLNAQFYRENLADLSSKIVLPQENENAFHTWNQFTLRVLDGKRNDLHQYLQDHHVGSAIYYPKTLDRQVCFEGVASDKGLPTKVAHQLAEEVLSIPIYPGLNSEQLSFVVETIRAFYR